MRGTLLALAILCTPSLHAGGEDELDELPSVAAGEAKEAFDEELRLTLEPFQAAFDPLAARWAELDVQHAAAFEAAREELAAGLREAVGLGRRRGDVDEALRLEAALQQLDSGATIPIAQEPGRAPRGSVKHDGARYALFEEASDWHAARSACEELGGHLACAETPAEYAFLVELAGGRAVWIGGTDARAEGDWVWLNGSPLRIPWGPGQPDDYMGFEHSATIRPDGTLDDRLGTDMLPFIGEWSASEPEAWRFDSRMARKAKERYDGAARAASVERARGRAKLSRALEKPFATAPADAIVRGDLRIKVFAEPLPCREAMRRAEELGGRLVVLADAERRTYAAGLISDEWHWVGAIDPLREREFEWIDGTPLDEGWLAGEPNNWRDNEFAVVLTPGGLVDALSEIRHKWICEWPVD